MVDGSPVGVGRGDEVPVDVVDVAGVLGIVLHQLPDDEGGDGGGDPLPGVDPCLQPDVGTPCATLGEGQHLGHGVRGEGCVGPTFIFLPSYEVPMLMMLAHSLASARAAVRMVNVLFTLKTYQ